MEVVFGNTFNVSADSSNARAEVIYMGNALGHGNVL